MPGVLPLTFSFPVAAIIYSTKCLPDPACLSLPSPHHGYLPPMGFRMPSFPWTWPRSTLDKVMSCSGWGHLVNVAWLKFALRKTSSGRICWGELWAQDSSSNWGMFPGQMSKGSGKSKKSEASEKNVIRNNKAESISWFKSFWKKFGTQQTKSDHKTTIYSVGKPAILLWVFS